MLLQSRMTVAAFIYTRSECNCTSFSFFYACVFILLECMWHKNVLIPCFSKAALYSVVILIKTIICDKYCIISRLTGFLCSSVSSTINGYLISPNIICILKNLIKVRIIPSWFDFLYILFWSLSQGKVIILPKKARKKNTIKISYISDGICKESLDGVEQFTSCWTSLNVFSLSYRGSNLIQTPTWLSVDESLVQ